MTNQTDPRPESSVLDPCRADGERSFSMISVPRRSVVAFLAALAIAFSAANAFAANSSGRDARKKLVMLVAEGEYETAKTLPEFAAKFLKDDFCVVIVNGKTTVGDNVFDRIEEIADAEVLLISVRRNSP